MLISIERQRIAYVLVKKTKKWDWDSGYLYKSDEAEKNLENLTETKLVYAMEESRLCLQSIIENHNSLTQKASFILALIGGLIGFVFTDSILKYDCLPWIFWLKISLAIYFVILIVVFWILIKYQLPFMRYSTGTPARNLLLKDVMGYDFKRIIIKQLEHYQKCINYNVEQLIQLAKNIKVCYWLAIGYPILIATIYLSFIFFFWCCYGKWK